MTDFRGANMQALEAQDRLAAKNVDIERLRARVAQLEAVLRYGTGAAINELAMRLLPQEWSPRSGIGVMLEALGCASTTYDDAVRAALKEAPQ